jgi:catechol 2,3-dioxygenase-like lactoylglutathione lyase family enzyme
VTTSGPRITYVNLSCPDPRPLARFYAELLGMVVTEESPDWILLEPPNGGVGLAFQPESGYRPPTWPARPGEQQMMVHLEIAVDDLEEALARALSLGATAAEFQPQADVRVCLDPAGHPFCLYLPD